MGHPRFAAILSSTQITGWAGNFRTIFYRQRFAIKINNKHLFNISGVVRGSGLCTLRHHMISQFYPKTLKTDAGNSVATNL